MLYKTHKKIQSVLEKGDQTVEVALLCPTHKNLWGPLRMCDALLRSVLCCTAYAKAEILVSLRMRKREMLLRISPLINNYHNPMLLEVCHMLNSTSGKCQSTQMWNATSHIFIHSGIYNLKPAAFSLCPFYPLNLLSQVHQPLHNIHATHQVVNLWHVKFQCYAILNDVVVLLLKVMLQLIYSCLALLHIMIHNTRHHKADHLCERRVGKKKGKIWYTNEVPEACIFIHYTFIWLQFLTKVIKILFLKNIKNLLNNNWNSHILICNVPTPQMWKIPHS